MELDHDARLRDLEATVKVMLDAHAKMSADSRALEKKLRA